jgi:hypothetical protein
VRSKKDDVSRLKYKAMVNVTNKDNRKTGRHFMVLVREIDVPVGVIATRPTDKRIEELGRTGARAFPTAENILSRRRLVTTPSLIVSMT